VFPACPLHGEDVPAVWQGLLAAGDRAPVPVPGAGSGAAFSRYDLVFHPTFFVTFGRWAEFAAAVDLARRGDASGFTGGRPRPEQPMFPGGSAVHCQDGLGYRGYDEYERAEQRCDLRVPWCAESVHRAAGVRTRSQNAGIGSTAGLGSPP
jgi:hypothetical protein